MNSKAKARNNYGRAYNFCAGPSTLPLEVLEKIQEELFNWRNGASILETSHRDPVFYEYTESIEARLRRLMEIPENYHVLFLSGGATNQFAMVPLNLLGEKKRAGYVNSGIWSKKAINEASKFCDVAVVANSEPSNYDHLPAQDDWQIPDDIAYLHYTTNETINGVEFNWIPELPASVPLVADMSSNILSRPIDVSRFGVIYAGAQKNIGPAGVTLVIVRDDLINLSPNKIPGMMKYNNQVENQSRYNTPPIFNWYVVGLVLEWLEKLGGPAVVEKQNIEKSKLLYDYIDQSNFYHNRVVKSCRSRMNVPFNLANESLESKFLSISREHKLTNLDGHRSVGGMRASIYNAMPIDGVNALIACMEVFKEQSNVVS